LATSFLNVRKDEDEEKVDDFSSGGNGGTPGEHPPEQLTVPLVK